MTSCESLAWTCWRRRSYTWGTWTAWSRSGYVDGTRGDACTRWRTGSAGTAAACPPWCASLSAPRTQPVMDDISLDYTVTGLQLRNSEQNCFHDNFLISQPIPMMWPSLKSSLRDDSNECNIIGFGWEIRKLAFWKLSILDLICCPDSNAPLSAPRTKPVMDDICLTVQ